MELMFLSDLEQLENLLSSYSFHADVLHEEDGSTTLSLDEIDLVENGDDEKEALNKLSQAIIEYAEDYYNDYLYWARGDRIKHIPYVIKALILNNVEKIGKSVKGVII